MHWQAGLKRADLTKLDYLFLNRLRERFRFAMLYIITQQKSLSLATFLLLISSIFTLSTSFTVPFLQLSHPTVRLSATVTANTEGSISNNTQTVSSPIEKEPTRKEIANYDFPWTEKQMWALSDNVSRFTVQVPIKEEKVDGVETTTLQRFTLWRSLSREVVELSGYPLSFLVERQMEMQNESELQKKFPKLIRTSKTILPYLDDYEFTTSGGLSGAVYGVQGLAEGTRIETAPLGNLRETLPKGFVQTECSVLYELGSSRNKPDDALKGKAFLSSAKDAVQDLNSGEIEKVGPIDRDLVQLGALTGILLVGASAFETLSHHLTVNVFWV